ncbi:MAG: arabinose-5-phosphate isomerase [Blastocatellia bacterium]|jgi:arabinose-5-phosphate isomerase|nr:arabinose-5-phosphate isomerase [Blastocatellia bacterium]
MEERTDYSQVVDLLRAESEAIAKAAARMQPAQIDRVMSLLTGCKGKIVLLGVGKSGIIAQKIAATMISSGTAAVHLPPSDALHGGLGIVSADDVVLLLSNSGETDELLQLLPYLKRREVPLVAIVGNLKSTIAQRADAVLDASVDQEACPLNLAPTTSTTVALAIGDALAMALMSAKGLTEDDFAHNHPAGQLGKRLTLRVADLMHGGTANPTISADAAWMEIITTITHFGLGAVNVIDREGRLEGIITDGDLRRSLQRLSSQELAFANIKCDELMTRDPIVTSAETLAFDALRLMEDRPSQINVLPVVDGQGLCIGLLRLHDIVRSGL